MITTLIAIGAAAFGIIAGFFLGAWVRQESINGLTETNRQLRNELALTKGNEGKFQLAMSDLKAQLEMLRENVGHTSYGPVKIYRGSIREP